ncbi:protein tyrosine phosphatase family protein [Novosphingobium sp. KN65.2]|uniref:protein tyrosine phosphatase family protein n=1 Tax=Novosphingobium sp. KN65.2 TaxID=1478134 RepID=UPI0005E96442|nr:protein tyrosine phosphatase family protein [Novosphingobium sp. KN65.2]CDO37097.1 conserved hypothetical protein [Novosphingobium sp. KN65.2]
MPNDPDDIPCWQRIDARLTTSGKLSPADPERLRALGVRHVINLALTDSPGALANEAALLAEAGIAYSHIPVPFDAPDEAHFAAFSETMAAAAEVPVHVHCILNWRVSAFVYRWNRQVRCMPEDEARDLLQVQWDPAQSDHKDAPAWARFIGDPR